MTLLNFIMILFEYHIHSLAGITVLLLFNFAGLTDSTELDRVHLPCRARRARNGDSIPGRR